MHEPPVHHEHELARALQAHAERGVEAATTGSTASERRPRGIRARRLLLLSCVLGLVTGIGLGVLTLL